MRSVIYAATLVSLATPSAEAQLFRRLFGRQEQHCQPVAYYQPTTYAAAVQYQPIAVVPAVLLAVDPYQYRVNPEAFASYREYMNSKSQQQSMAAATVAERPPVTAGTASSGADILQRSCIQCHQAGRAPKAGFAMFDESGTLASNLPLQEMLSRMASDDPQARMPPKAQLPNHDILAVMRMAVEGIQPRPVQTVTNDQPASPF
jgi:mono/diheme cytochrome c family protein